VLIVLIATPSLAEDGGPASAMIPARLPAVVGYTVDHWSSEDGPPLRGGWSVAQTPDGYVWVGTPDGLSRYDGTNFTVFRGEEVPALKGARAGAMRNLAAGVSARAPKAIFGCLWKQRRCHHGSGDSRVA